MTAIAVLGSTGSIGVSTLDVVARHRDRYRVHALAAHSDHRGLLAQCLGLVAGAGAGVRNGAGPVGELDRGQADA